MEVEEGCAAMTLTHAYEEMTPEKRPQDPHTAIIPHGHYCVSYTQAGIDCSFTSYAECEGMASGQSAECYGNTPADDEDPWNTRAQQFSRNTRAQQFSRRPLTDLR